MAKILVIDDDPQLRLVVIQALTGAGHEMLEASDGAEGLGLFRVQGPVLVIVDILMPQKDGLETIRELRREAPGVAIIAMSGRGATFLGIAKKFGADAAIAKPFRRQDLVKAVNKLLKP